MLAGRLDAGGVITTQATSPYFATSAFWCIQHTFEDVFKNAVPFQTNVPTFGIWGFVAAGGGINNVFVKDSANYKKQIQKDIASKLKKAKHLGELKYFNDKKIPAMLFFEKDTEETPTEINTISTQKLVYYYNHSAENWR